MCLYLSKDTINNGDELKYEKAHDSPALLENLKPNQLVLYYRYAADKDGKMTFFGRLRDNEAKGKLDINASISSGLVMVLTVEFKDPNELTDNDLVLYNHTKEYPTEKDSEILKIGEHYTESKAKGFKEGSAIIAYKDGKWKYGTYQGKSRSGNKHVVSMEENKNVHLEHVYALKLSQIPMDNQASRNLSID